MLDPLISCPSPWIIISFIFFFDYICNVRIIFSINELHFSFRWFEFNLAEVHKPVFKVSFILINSLFFVNLTQLASLVCLPLAYNYRISFCRNLRVLMKKLRVNFCSRACRIVLGVYRCIELYLRGSLILVIGVLRHRLTHDMFFMWTLGFVR